jgi:hypothetical protein
MTPTPAQIEAAAQSFVLWSENSNAIPTDELNDAIAAALTAAAEVGERGTDHDDGHGWERMVMAMQLATIERCAQVAENHMYGAGAAIAIRLLKDKPK